MNRQEALQALGLDSNATPGEIETAIAGKQAQLKQALEKAPTGALKTKYQQPLEKLDRIAEALLASGQPSGNSRAGLSRTKLADLPQSATQFDDGSAARVNLQAGDVLANRYQVQEQIGAGGMGAVYRALDKTTGKEIALKVLLPGLLKNERARERFLDEARISQQLSHPNIVNVFDVQQDGDFFFLTMELLEGQDLRQVMENRSLARQPFSEQEMRTIAEQVCDALAYAHKYTVHRDLKPENVWLTEDGDYKLMDFGIARVQSTSQRTQTGAAMGTAYYMAPEQLKGQKTIDGRADQYALGVMLYELATGEVPAGIIKPMRELRRDLPRGFSNTVMRTLSSSPEDRFADIAAFNEALNKGGGFELNLPWKGRGIAAGVLVAVLGVGTLASSGSFSLEGLKSLLPMSKEEVAAERASLAKIQGEIKVLKQRLESGRRSLDSDVRAAERNGTEELRALASWQELTENAIFNGDVLTELEGDYAMAEALLQDKAFDQARIKLEQVREGYQRLWKEFSAAQYLYEWEQKVAGYQRQWDSLVKGYDVDAPQETQVVEEAIRSASDARLAGEFRAARNNWQEAEQSWRDALEVARQKIALIDRERAAEAERKRELARQAKAEAERARAEAERARKAAEVRQQSVPVVLEFHKEHVGGLESISSIESLQIHENILSTGDVNTKRIQHIKRSVGSRKEEASPGMRTLLVQSKNHCKITVKMDSLEKPHYQDCTPSDPNIRGLVSPLLRPNVAEHLRSVGIKQDENGKEHYVLATRGDGAVMYYHIGRKSGMLERVSLMGPSGKQMSHTVYEDFRGVGNVRLPFRTKYYLRENSLPTSITTLQKVLINEPMSDSLFAN